MRRREFFHAAAMGIAAAPSPFAFAAALDQASVHAPGRTHFEPKAQRLLMLFLTGGYSHVDTFDYKPRLKIDHDKPLGPGVAMASPFSFQRCGRSGLWMSELFPHLA